MIEAVIFDMDGLMLDTEKLLAQFWMQAAREAGFPMELHHVLGIRSLAAIYAKPHLQGIFGEDFDYERIRARRRELTAAHIAAHGIEKKPGLDALLCYLKAHGYRTCVATATDRERTDLYLKQIGVHHFFDAFVCGDMVTKGKPDPEIYLTACQALGLPPQNCMALEDSPNGILSAHAAGCMAVMIPDLSQPDDALLERMAACVPDLTRVIDLLELLEEVQDGQTQCI
ncbi:MAG: HAD family phosphatase [Oscillospiraceae bacterium]|nr:HAD family phosphatase [Ruminococcus sp.]MBQ7013092.1 HAD family phosphatase [Oscillospiraceae bacterium]